MDAKLKQKWIEALRSGDFKQATGKFKKDGSFCCLGVLCVVGGVLPLTCGDWGNNYAFVDEAVGSQATVFVLEGMNDGGDSFPKIADYIEQHVPAEG